MDFSLSLAMCPPDRLIPLARAAEEAGWDSVSVPDSVFFPESVSADYPFTTDGGRFWDPSTPFVDPLVSIPAIAAVTERLRFITSVLKTPLRQPLLVAKSIGSIAAMFPGRIDLGIGLSWIPEEFKWLGEDMSTRGRRLDEQIEIMRLAFGGGWFEYHGDHYDFDRLRMDPSPSAPIPILVGGHSEAALRRAVTRGDGWLGAQLDRTAIDEALQRLRRSLDDHDRDPEGFQVLVTPLVAARPDVFADLAEAGVTGVITMPWYFLDGDPNDPTHQVESVAWFAETVIEPLRMEKP